LPSYYERFGGSVIAAAINKYVFVTVMKPFLPGIYLKYSKQEVVDTVDKVQHPLIREALRVVELEGPQVEITTLADIPAGTGLGSSGSFTTALLKALFTHRREMILPSELAALACDIEINRLNEPVGKQDQYIAAYGGITCFDFHPDGTVSARPLKISSETLFDLEDHLLLFFTGFDRRAGSILQEQVDRSVQSDAAIFENLHEIKDLGERSKRALESGKCREFGDLMHEHWEKKRKRSAGMSNPLIDDWYSLGRQHGAIGGKLVGAGGGGFLMFYAEDRAKLRRAMMSVGLPEVRFEFDFDGTKSLL
jgi:D-glycero-alpha-D-manno-heptose-7-phosphate kinase